MQSLKSSFRAVFAFLRAPTWADAKQVLITRGEGLQAEAVRMCFTSLRHSCRDEPLILQILETNWSVLQRCLEEGIEEVLTEEQLSEPKPQLPPGFDLSAKLDAQQAELLSLLGPSSSLLAPMLANLLGDSENNLQQFLIQGLEHILGATSNPGAASAEAFQLPPELMSLLRGSLKQAAEQNKDLLPRLEQTRDMLLDTINTFVSAPTWSESQTFLEAHPELLTLEAEQILEGLIDRDSNLMKVGVLRQNRDLLRACRDKGVDQAFAELMKSSEPYLPTHLVETFQEAQNAERRYLNTSNPAALEEAIERWDRIYHDPTFASTPPDFQFDVLNGAGDAFAYAYYRVRPDLAVLDQAILFFEQAAAIPRSDPGARAQPLGNIGYGLYSRAQATDELSDWNKAIEALRVALAALMEASPEQPSMFFYFLADSLRRRHGLTDNLDDLDEAITCYHRLLETLPSQEAGRATILNDLGASMSDRYAATGDSKDLEAAMRYYQQARTAR